VGDTLLKGSASTFQLGVSAGIAFDLAEDIPFGPFVEVGYYKRVFDNVTWEGGRVPAPFRGTLDASALLLSPGAQVRWK
jgi:hypothetical protein